jgi:hypothetical protein
MQINRIIKINNFKLISKVIIIKLIIKKNTIINNS